MSSNTPSADLGALPIPNIKTVVHSVLKPELKALVDIVQAEIQYMRNCIEEQNVAILRLQSIFAQQTNLILDQVSKLSDTVIQVNDLEARKADEIEFQRDRFTYNNAIETIHNSLTYVEGELVRLVNNDTDHNSVLSSLQYIVAQQVANSVTQIDLLNSLDERMDSAETKLETLEQISTTIDHVTNLLNGINGDILSTNEAFSAFQTTVATQLQEVRDNIAAIEAFLAAN